MGIVAGLLLGTGFVVWMFGMVLLRGWALSVLWQWFAVPIFQLPPLSIAQAFGVAVLVGFLFHQRIPNKDGEKWEPMVYATLEPLVALAIGWIVKGFM